MSFFKSTWMALRSVFVNGRAEDELHEEMAFHLEMQIRHNIEQGMDPVAAKKQAIKSFGGTEKLKEDCRDSWGLRFVADLIRDLKFGLRRLKKSPGFTVVAIVSLSIAIGANTAIFSMINAILYRPLPVSHPEELREILFVSPRLSNAQIRGSSSTLPDGRKVTNAVTHSLLLALQESAKDHAYVVGFSSVRGIQVNARGVPFAMGGMMVSGNFFKGMGVGAILGRTIRSEDDRSGSEPVAVLSYSLWQRRFGGNPEVVGELISLNHTGFRVIGVLPRGFLGPEHGSEHHLYVPLSNQPVIQPELELLNENHWWIWVMARLKTGSSNEQLKASLDLALERSITSDRFAMGEGARNGESVTRGRGNQTNQKLVLLRDETDQYKNFMRSILLDGSAGSENEGSEMATPFVVMLGAAAIVLLAACANLAGLLIARSISQEHETATRKALGAGSLRLVKQGITESLLLAVMGALFGWMLSLWGRGLIIRAFEGPGDQEWMSGVNDHRVFLFVTLITILAAFLFGLLPSLRSFRINLMDALRDRSESRGGWLTGRFFVALQVGLALLLIVGAGLLLRSVSNIRAIHPGFNVDNLLMFELNAKNGGYEGPQKIDFYQRSMEAVRGLPGIKSVAGTEIPFLSNSARTIGIIKVPDNPDFEGDNVYAMTVSEDFFHTVEVPLLSGRVFEQTDVQGSEPVVIVNESFARTFFGERNPIGKQVLRGQENTYRIVGVCADTRYHRIKAEVRPILFFPIKQANTGSFGMRKMTIYAKTEMDPLALVSSVRKAMAEIDPNIPLNDLKSQAIQMDENLFREKVQAMILVVFGLLGVFLSCIGTYGLMAYTVSRRTSEIGIRKALGAGSNEAIRPILKSSLIVASIGLVLGAVFVLPLGNLIRDQLYRVNPLDPMVLFLGMLLLFIASVAAAWFPARKAAKVSPMEALRVE